jgi:hypothetical protein
MWKHSLDLAPSMEIFLPMSGDKLKIKCCPEWFNSLILVIFVFFDFIAF